MQMETRVVSILSDKRLRALRPELVDDLATSMQRSVSLPSL
jgi:hypothetical protein